MSMMKPLSTIAFDYGEDARKGCNTRDHRQSEAFQTLTDDARELLGRLTAAVPGLAKIQLQSMGTSEKPEIPCWTLQEREGVDGNSETEPDLGDAFKRTS
jgi:hypothetical protein